MFSYAVICALLGSSFALLMHDPKAHPQFVHVHKEHKHPDQSSVDSEQARNIFRRLTKGNATLDIQDFRDFLIDSDANHDGQVTSDEFLREWYENDAGSAVNAVPFFVNLDANKDGMLTEKDDLKIIFSHFDRNDDSRIDEGEFVVQWVKMSTV